MGNTSTRYVTAPVAADILGGPDSLNALKSKLEKIVGKYIDFRVFHDVIQRKYEKIPRVLCECLFRAFATDLGSRVELDAFLAGYATMETTSPNYKSTIANLNTIQARFLFRVYENEYSGSSTGTLHRRRIEDMLKLAYGDRLKPHLSAVQQQLDSIFSRFQATEITLKEFESCNVKLDMLSGWVRSVLRAFFSPDVQHSRLYHLERKYSAQLEAQEIMSTYQLSRTVCDDLRRRFFELCSSPHNSDIAANSLGIDGGDQQVVHLGARAELRCSAWLHGVASVLNEVNSNTATANTTPISTTDSQAIPYLDPALARVMFESRVDAFKPKWRFLDFATFCAVFGGENRTLQAVTVTDAFIQCALSDYYNSKISTVNKTSTSTAAAAPVLNRESSAESMGSDTSAVQSDPHTNSSNNISVSNSTAISSPFAQLSPQSPTPVCSDMSNVDNYILSALCDMIYTLARSAARGTSDSYSGTGGADSTAGSGMSGESPRVLSPVPTIATQLPKDLAEALQQLQSTEPEGYAMAFSTLIISHYAQLPGMRDLSLCACCRFGFNPSSPLREMEFVTELSLRYLQQHPQTSMHPSGPVDSEWCVLPKQWYDNWKLYVGHHQHQVPHASSGTSGIGASSMNIPVKSAKSRNIDTTTGSYSNPYSHYNFQAPGVQSTHSAYIPASVAGSVLDLDGLVSDSPPRAAFYGSGAGGAGTGGGSQSGSKSVTAAAAPGDKSDAAGSSRGTSMKRAGPPPVRPPSIDNSVLLKRTTHNTHSHYTSHSTGTSKGVYGRQGQLLPNLIIGKDIEVVAPAVYDTLVAWYGGGPRISRKVVPATKPSSSGVLNTSVNAAGTAGGSGIYSRANTAYGFGASPAVSPRFSTSAVASELELYPLCLVLHTCDNAGYMHTNPLCDALFSKTCTVQDIATYLCSTHTIDLPRIRLWNYALPSKEKWREQYILSPELTLQRANLIDNQIILLEVSLLDGAWPRSLLHAHLDSEERVNQDAAVSEESAPVSAVVSADSAVVSEIFVDEYTGVAATVLPDSEGNSGGDAGDISTVGAEGAEQTGDEANAINTTGAGIGAATGSTVLGTALPSKKHFASSGRKGSKGARDAAGSTIVTTARRNSGLVGLDNLGNTCYMNSSLQALLHTEPLTQYFLSNAYTRHVNLHSMHGFHGKLAASYGRLAQEVFCTTSNCVTPRAFKYDIANLHEQFAGNEQHDAHELLAFLLDGLSEDLNLVHTKPYTTQPDSDGRSDHVLADIWWGNHLKRDRSVIQALFSGQFKSVMTCTAPGCGYSSARFEPFNFLSVPVPEESERILTVTVVPLQQHYTVYCEVRVPKNGTIQDVVDGVLRQDICGIDDSVDYSRYTASSRHKRHKRHHRGPHSSHRDTSSSANKPEFYFQAGELANNRIRSFNSLDRRIDSIRDNEYLVLYQVRRLPGDIERVYTVGTADAPGAVSASASASVSGSAEVSNSGSGVVSANIAIPGSGPPSPQSPGSSPVPLPVAPVSAPVDGNGADKSNSGSSAAHPGRNVFNPETLYGDYCKADKLVRVALTQRRVRMHDASLFVTNTSSDFSLLGPGGLFSGTSAGSNTTGGGNKGLNNANSDTNGGGGCTGGEYFKLESFGLSSLEVLPNRIRCGDLYRLVAKRFSAYLKVPVKALIRHRQAQRQHLKHTSSASSLSSLGNGTNKGDAAPALGSAEEYPINLRMAQIGSADTDEVVGGAIPEEGFTLRLVNGGTGANSCCSRCPWLMHCDGCVLPDHNDIEVELRDGESIAVDWHFVVFEDLLDTSAICNLRSHSTSVHSGGSGGNGSSGVQPASPSSPVSPVSQHGRADNYIHTPLQRCLDKFTEQEKLEGVVCPRCRASDGNMCKSFTLWRLPPVLIVQLKRFQFDQYSRRKLNNHIDFPFEGLDLFDYLATSRKRGLSTVSLPDTGAEGPNAAHGDMSVDSKALAIAALYGDSSPVPVSPSVPTSTPATTTTAAGTQAANHANPSATPKAQESSVAFSGTAAAQELITEDFAPDATDDQCTKYDLYSVIHHAGALGGGHYATTARALNIRSGAANTSAGAGAAGASDTTSAEGSWYVYNDHMVSKVTDTREICSPSAYVLFYMRQDMRQGDVLALLRHQLSIPLSLHEEGEQTEETVHNTNTSNASHVSGAAVTVSVPQTNAPAPVNDTVIAPGDATLNVLPQTTITSRGDTIGTSTNNGFSGFIDGDAESDEVLRNLRKNKQHRQSKFAADTGGREDSAGGCLPS